MKMIQEINYENMFDNKLKNKFIVGIKLTDTYPPKIYTKYKIEITKEDNEKINKFLELLPDDSIKRIFYSLSTSKILRINDAHIMDKYLEYIRDFNLSFENKNLDTNHKKFQKSFNELDSFILFNFFLNNSNIELLELYDASFRERLPKKYEKFNNELKILIDEAENKYYVFRKLIEEYVLENNIPESKIKENAQNNKYSTANEDILLKTLGIKIKGDYITRGAVKKEINATDKTLIYFLYYKSIKNNDECCTLDDLSKEKSINKSKRYISNRISIINKLIKEIITKELNAKIPKFIKTEPKKRGYHLNPKIIHIKSKRIKK